jgi:hypothetical protein
MTFQEVLSSRELLSMVLLGAYLQYFTLPSSHSCDATTATLLHAILVTCNSEARTKSTAFVPDSVYIQ